MKITQKLLLGLAIFNSTALIAMEQPGSEAKLLSPSDKACTLFTQALTARITETRKMLDKGYVPEDEKNFELSQDLAKMREQELMNHYNFIQKLTPHQSFAMYKSFERPHNGNFVSLKGYNPQDDETKLRTLARELANYDAKMEAAIITFAEVIALHQLAAESMREKLEKSKVTPTATQIRRVVD